MFGAIGMTSIGSYQMSSVPNISRPNHSEISYRPQTAPLCVDSEIWLLVFCLIQCAWLWCKEPTVQLPSKVVLYRWYIRSCDDESSTIVTSTLYVPILYVCVWKQCVTVILCHLFRSCQMVQFSTGFPETISTPLHWFKLLPGILNWHMVEVGRRYDFSQRKRKLRSHLFWPLTRVYPPGHKHSPTSIR